MSNYTEIKDSQIPALKLLQKMGWKYISPEQTEKERGGLLSGVILENILAQQLEKINSFEYKGGTYQFSSGNIHNAIHALKNVPDDGLLKTSEHVFDLLNLGKSFEEHIQGDKKSFTINYIDWEHPKNNVYHITDEFEVQGVNVTRRPDLVLFINGIPFCVIENKRRDKKESTNEAISQFIRNQKKDEGIPKLFHYTQLLLAVQPNEVKYATTGTPAKFWSFWKEQTEVETETHYLIHNEINQQPAENRLPTEQDRMLYCLCRPERVMELAYMFTLYDGGIKKVARYQQYFAVKNGVNRVLELKEDGQRKGGVIWHTQGSGKSLTMVMLAKSIILNANISNARMIVVTDRVELDKQIATTFEKCGKKPMRAKSGNHLIDLIQESNTEVVTTIIDKFESALKRKDFRNKSENIFVLVDESHRSQYGKNHALMKKALPMACYIGFTGTPLMSAEKNTANKFGGYIHQYTIDQAVADGAVLPLLYEGRSAKLNVNQGLIDKGFDRLSEPLNKYQKKDLKQKFSSITEIYKSEQVVEEIAYDISEHYCKNWKGQLKAIIAVPLKETALKYQKYFENQPNPKLKMDTAVIISQSDTRPDHDEVEEESTSEVQQYFKKINATYGSVEAYEEQMTNKFKDSDDEVDILIVVGKLLTGFDAPRCGILYIAKPLKEHGLLQAIARANRLREGKDFGYIVDYVGVLGDLDKALTSYSALKDFDESDLAGAIKKVDEEINKIPQYHSAVWDLFKSVSNKSDLEALGRFLQPKDLRDQFRERLILFAKSLQAGMASDVFYSLYSADRQKTFISDLKLFQALRTAVQLRYAEKIDYKEYEGRVRKLLDMHIGVEAVEQTTESINIFNDEVFKKEVEKLTGTTASKADAIAYKMKKVIAEKMDEDPVFYTKFSKLISDAIQAFIDKRITEAEYLKQILKAREDLTAGRFSDTPGSLQGNPEARAFYNIVKDVLNDQIPETNSKEIDEKLASAGTDLCTLIERLLIRDWKKNDDIQKQMKNDIEDYLLDHRSEYGVELSFTQLDIILDKVMSVAKTVF
ncbi:type I restriction endonuclease subunit R [Crocinitomix algicola]|uniref:type I restriction endonuclease subunit R n=1 Tax=Crocinitomix algicola TaxID=1740263 RepID=UPI000872D9D6|nr:HsdR family type I site-specific deoxyribonuclease [Crocinitomix algicola]